MRVSLCSKVSTLIPPFLLIQLCLLISCNNFFSLVFCDDCWFGRKLTCNKESRKRNKDQDWFTACICSRRSHRNWFWKLTGGNFCHNFKSPIDFKQNYIFWQFKFGLVGAVWLPNERNSKTWKTISIDWIIISIASVVMTYSIH